MLSRIALGTTCATRTVFSVPRTSVQSQIVRGFRLVGAFDIAMYKYPFLDNNYVTY